MAPFTLTTPRGYGLAGELFEGDMTARFRINTPHVVAETLDGEATIVDLDSGTYYALNESGSLIWDGLISGVTKSEVAEDFANAYELDGDEATRAVDDLAKKLADAALIVDAGEAGQNGNRPAATAAAQGSANGSRRQYAEPELSSYTDMQELLLLDPIHEVDESGWPSQP
jgi:Coenzyme PQQ synthesis protein D (PqqD)